MIFAVNCSDALNIAMKSLLRSGDHVITSTLEHNSVSRPLQAMADSGFITLTRVEFSPSAGTIDPAEIRAAITPKTKLIVLTHASNVLGTIQPITDVGAIARENGVTFLVDAAQTIGVVPIDIKAMNIDLIAFPGHKSLLGPTGTGALYVNHGINVEQLLPFREGGTGGDSSSPTMPRQFPYFLEGGTPNTVGLAGLGAGVKYVTEHNPEGTLVHEQAHLQQIIDALSANPKVTLYGPTGPNSAKTRVGALSFNVEGYSPQEVGGILDESFSIAIRPGLHCSPYAHKQIGSFPDGTVRVSPGAFTTDAEIATFNDAIAQITA
jgi:cysteine desulfurase/selenocysteine lyase